MLSDREIAGALGQVADGGSVPAELARTLRQALRGAVQTRDRGLRLFYVQVDTAALPNVDTEEAIWSAAADGVVRGARDEALFDLQDVAAVLEHQVIPLPALGDPAQMRRLMAAFQESACLEACEQRVLQPLALWLRAQTTAGSD